jgi:putative ABC transport system permease protein
VLRQVGIMTLIGGFIGLTASFWLGTVAEGLLFELDGRDPVVFLTATVLLTLVALAAGLIPAHRASRVDPMTALRYE